MEVDEDTGKMVERWVEEQNEENQSFDDTPGVCVCVCVCCMNKSSDVCFVNFFLTFDLASCPPPSSQRVSTFLTRTRTLTLTLALLPDGVDVSHMEHTDGADSGKLSNISETTTESLTSSNGGGDSPRPSNEQVGFSALRTHTHAPTPTNPPGCYRGTPPARSLDR